MSHTSLALKRERSPTPPLTLAPRTSGVKLVAPLPFACRKSSLNYLQSRRKWLRDEVKILNALGLTVTNKFIREDGLSLEWESPVPVWPDTLRPATMPASTTLTPAEDDVEMSIEPQTPHVSQEEEQEKQASELEDMAIEFLEKYAKTFDSNRAALSSAYASNALFSYCVHEHDSVPRNSVAAAFTNTSAAVHRFAPRKGARNLLSAKTWGNLYSGPSEIIPAVLSLGPHKFCARSPTNLRWNALVLQVGQGSGSKPLIFMSSHGDLTEEKEDSEKRLSFDQCFLLQRPEGSEIDRGSIADWPLVAISHQLTVRDLSLRPLAL